MRSNGIAPNQRYKSAMVQVLRGGLLIVPRVVMAEPLVRDWNVCRKPSYHARHGEPIAAPSRQQETGRGRFFLRPVKRCGWRDWILT